eukprot:11756846-Ditylum_brightwellii.AAC.1
MEPSDQSQDYIKHICLDIITKSLETIAALLRNRRGDFLKLVWTPWFDNLSTKALIYLTAGSLTKAAGSLNWLDGRELLKNVYFNIHTRKDGTESKKRSINIRILYNGEPEDRKKIRRYLQKQLRTKGINVQVWLSCLQTCAQPMKARRIIYSATIFKISQFVKNVLEIIYKEKRINIKVSIIAEAAFEAEIKGRRFYDGYNSVDLDQWGKLNLHKVFTI